MENKTEQTVHRWGSAQALAPSIKRADPAGWLAASAIAGAALSLLALSLLWRELPGLPSPVGALREHLGLWAQSLANMAMPRVFAGGASRYAAFWASLSSGQRLAIEWRVGVAALLSPLPAALLRSSYLTPRDGLVHTRGGFRLEGEAAKASLRKRFARANAREPDHEIAPGVPFPVDMWTRHVVLFAGSGAGKSTMLKPLIQKVIAAGERALIFDPKGEFTMGFPEPAIVAPWDERSHAWDIAKDLRNIGDMRRFAAAMIEDSQDPMWANAARQILVGFAIYLKRARGDDWGWRELADLVAMPQASLLPLMSKHHPEAVRSVERASVTTQGILINLSSFCAPIFDLADAWGQTPASKRISFVEWTLGKGPRRQIILQGHGSYAELAKAYVCGVFGVVGSIVNSPEMVDDRNRKLWVICEEFSKMGKVAVIDPLIEMGRSRGVRCVIACQDLAQLEAIHGEKAVKSMVSMCSTLIVGQTMQGDTAEQISKAMGTREVERANASTSMGGAPGSGKSTTLSFARDELAIYKPSELASRLGPTPDGKGVVMALVTGGQAHELYWPRFDFKRARPNHVAAAWTLGVAGKSKAAPDLPPTERLISPTGRPVEATAAMATAVGEAGTPSSTLSKASEPAALEGDPAADPSTRSLGADDALIEQLLRASRGDGG